MEYDYRERGARQAAAGPDQPRPQSCAATPPGTTPWKTPTKDASPEIKLTSDGQIVEAGYGHGV
jgi:hypothetical protein